MSESHALLTDHEWMLKMAEEGKALYIPGKTVAQMNAESAAKAESLAQKSSRTITMTVGDWLAIDTAIPDVIEALHDVRNVFCDLAYMDSLNQPWVNSVMRLAGRAFRSIEEKEGRVLEELDSAIRLTLREDSK